MNADFNKPRLNSAQKASLKELYKRDNYHALIAIFSNFFWILCIILASQYIIEKSGFWIVLPAAIVIGARQRALASLLHEAAHGILFKTKILNETLGRIICGWTILQSFSAYRTSHVLNHHPKIGEKVDDPDLKFMMNEGVYDAQSRGRFIWCYIVLPLTGLRSPAYLWFLLRDRLLGNLLNTKFRTETICLILFHVGIIAAAFAGGWITQLTLYWYLPFCTSFSVIGWFSELSEHFPMMQNKTDSQIYSARNRYAAWYERLLIGMHGDSFHLTHHLFPSIPHWNLKAATEILRQDDEFREWDNVWGGIFSSSDSSRLSLVKYIMNVHRFPALSRHSPMLRALLA